MSTTGHENEAINVRGLKASLQKFKSELVDVKADQANTYTKTEVNALVSTPHQNYVTVANYASLPATGSADTIYRVSSWDGSANSGAGAVDATVYSEYAWNGSDYVFLCVKSQIDEVFDITAYNSNTKYADLAAALGVDGANIPSSLRRGGMSVKFVCSSDNKYVQCRLMANQFSTTPSDWQGIDAEPTDGSKNLVESGGVFNAIHEYVYTDNNPEFKKLELDSDDTIISGIDYKNIKHHYIKNQFEGGLLANEINLCGHDLENVVVKTETLADDAICKTIIAGIIKSSSSVVTIMTFSNPTHKPKQLYIKVLSNESSLSRVSVEYIKEDGTYEYAGHDIPTGVDVAINVDNSRSVNQIFYNSQNITQEGKISIRIYESNRDILWLGTSIPAGVVASVGSYPSLVGKSLGINVINKALGESYLRRNATPPTQFEHFVGRCLSETEAEKIAYLRPLYEGGQMTEEQYNSYIKFGYDYRILPYINGTKASCDTVVIDHGYNDRGSFDTILNNWGSQDFILHSSDASFDRTNYVGAFCFLLKKIWEVNPNIRILVISHLENLTGSDIFPNDVQGRRGYKVCMVQKKIAEHFDFPFIDICNNIGFSMNIIPSTADYLSDFNARYGTSYSPVDYTGETNPSTCVTRFQMFCPDSVHPHSDLSGLSLKMIANVLINKLNKLL